MRIEQGEDLQTPRVVLRIIQQPDLQTGHDIQDLVHGCVG